MDRRTHESPMDFEWQNQGPVDPTSPFYQLSQKQGTRRTFESPSKPPVPRTETKPTTFASTTTTATPFRNPSFTTPRKAFDVDMFSETSGAESSPADNADTEDTPDTIRVADVTAPKANPFARKQPLFGRYGLYGGSPGRGEIRRHKHIDAMHKVRKRKRVDLDHAVSIGGRRGSTEDDSDSDTRHKQPPTPPGFISSIASFITSNPTLPYILSYYAQLLLNYFLVAFVIYVVYCFWATIRSDVDKASEAAMAAVVAEMASCASQYAENRCARDQRVPAMAALCAQWEGCMNRDPSGVGRARVSAHTFAEIFNSFVEPISWKAMLFMVMIVLLTFGVSNFAFGVFRAKMSHPPPAPQYFNPPPPPTPSLAQQYPWGLPPQTPRHPSQGALEQSFYAGGEAVHHHFPALMPAPKTPGRRSPSKGNW